MIEDGKHGGKERDAPCPARAHQGFTPVATSRQGFKPQLLPFARVPAIRHRRRESWHTDLYRTLLGVSRCMTHEAWPASDSVVMLYGQLRGK